MISTQDLKHDTEEQTLAPVTQLQPRRSIYNIQHDYLLLMDEIEGLEGEITPEMEERLAINKDELENKAVSYGYLIKQFDMDIEQIGTEIARLNKILLAKTKAQSTLKTTISETMQRYGIMKVQQNNLTLSFRKSESLMIDQGAHVPVEYITTKEVETVDKKGLKEAIKEGKEFLGIYIQENQNLQIK